MKFQTGIKIFAVFATAACSGLYAQTTKTFNIPGTNGFVKDFPGLSASGSVTFTNNIVNVSLTNGSTINSTITKFYMLKPSLLSNTASLDAAPSGWNLTNTLDDPNQAGNPGTILSLTSAFPAVSADDYFGAYNLDKVLGPGGSANFTFSFLPTTGYDWENYGTDLTRPAIVIRWQEVGVNDTEGSSAGYGWFTDDDIPTTPVPEPRLIAPLAVLGLGGLLYVRRRIKGKGKKTA